MQKWQSWYGTEFGPLTEIELFSDLVDLINPYAARSWKTLSPPVLLADVDFKRWKGLWLNNTRTVTASASGRLNGVYFELMVGPNTFLSTHPALVDEDNHWLSPVYVFVEPLSLQDGDQFDVTYQYRFVSCISRCEVRRRRS